MSEDKNVSCSLGHIFELFEESRSTVLVILKDIYLIVNMHIFLTIHDYDICI